MSNRISVVLTALLASLALSCSGGGEAAPVAASPPTAVRVVAATTADVPLEIDAIGNAEAASSVDVKSRLTAPILGVHFSEGQDVKKGEILFDLDAESINRQAAELEANIARDLANEKQAEANIARDQATYRNAQSMADRGTKLAKEGILAREQADQNVASAEAAAASAEADRAALDSARAAEKADRARLTQMRLQLDYTKIVAPISGRAGTIAVKQGNLAKENDTTLVTILENDPIYISFAVPESILPEIRRYNTSKPLEVTAFTSDNKASTGVLRFIDSSVDATSGTIKLKAVFRNATRSLWPGQFVTVRARLNVEHDRVLVPSQVVQTGPQGRYIWVLNPADSTVAMRPVNVLRTYTPAGQPEQAVVGSGLAGGERVVSEGQLRLIPGAHVRILAANQGQG